METMGTRPVCFKEVVRGVSEEVAFAVWEGANMTGAGSRGAGLHPSDHRESGGQSC